MPTTLSPPLYQWPRPWPRVWVQITCHCFLEVSEGSQIQCMYNWTHDFLPQNLAFSMNFISGNSNTKTRRRQWHPTPVLLPRKSHGWKSVEGCSPWGCWGWDTTERLHFHFSLSCIGEGNGNPLQCSCLENPRHGEAWWAALWGRTESDTTEVT